MKKYLGSAIAFLLLAMPSAASAGDLKLTMNNGLVTLVATDVPVSQILAEWARIGKTTILNGEKLAGPPLTLQLVDVPERQALEVLLRSASGYVAAPRPVNMVNASSFDRILIMPTSRPPAVSAVAAAPQPFRPQPQQVQPEPDVDDDEPVEPVMPPGMGPRPDMPAQNVPGMPSNVPGAQPPGGAQQPMTAPRPGMLTPAPGQPNPYGTPQPAPLPPGVRPPGGGGEGNPDDR